MQTLRSLAGKSAVFGKKCHMAHLAAGTYVAFPVVMEERAGILEQPPTFGVSLNRPNVFTNEIDHGGRAQQPHVLRRKATDDENLLFKLGQTAGIE